MHPRYACQRGLKMFIAQFRLISETYTMIDERITTLTGKNFYGQVHRATRNFLQLVH